MAQEKRKSRAKYMRKHRKEEREFIRIGKHFWQKNPKLVERELGRRPMLTIKPRAIKIRKLKLPTLFEDPKRKTRQKKGG